MNTPSPILPIPLETSGITSSRQGMFNVLNYSPRMGLRGTTITIHTLFTNTNRHDPVRIRIVIGHKPILTGIENIGAHGEASTMWRCTGIVPEFYVPKGGFTSTQTVTLQALGECGYVLDTVTFGNFTYASLPPSDWFPFYLSDPVRGGNPRLHAAQPPLTHSALFRPRGRASPASHSASFRPKTRKRQASPAPLGCQAPKRRRVLRRHENKHDVDSSEVTLAYMGDPTDIGKDLSETGRVLVRCICKQDGAKLHLSFHAIREEEYDDQFVVISCIYREGDGRRYFTSVDMIRLVEYMVQEQLTADEKSRIRRNLESLSPKTITRATSDKFFQVLMEFPAPQPRNIEKDIKVFEWDTLTNGLRKIMDKYSWVIVPLSSTPLPAEPRLPAYVDDIFQQPPPYSSAALGSSDGTNTPDGSGRANLVPAMHVNPSLLHSQGLAIGSPAPGPLMVGGDMPPPSPRGDHKHVEAGDSSQMQTHYEPTDHSSFDSLGLHLQTLHEHGAHAGTVPSFF
ncbi:hypothetical protein F5148DRAFT_1281083 [Russula earlei]|uniref:Uncharacterized protein n=1 Tax=Russula earlei TaxID=71964 RepID=A0ACC0UI14_9AGAM|nr:hypothetical protein F5148DRAFT_1281083 [Russula earlei]